jgi:hypothetical protein
LHMAELWRLSNVGEPRFLLVLLVAMGLTAASVLMLSVRAVGGQR